MDRIWNPAPRHSARSVDTTRSGPTPMGNAPFSGRAAGCSQIPSQVETVQMKTIGGLLPPHIRRGFADGYAL